MFVRVKRVGGYGYLQVVRTLGQFGHSKERRSDRWQVVVGALLTPEGQPIKRGAWSTSWGRGCGG